MTEFSDFINLVHTTQDKELLEDFLFGVTTPKERQELAKRMEIIERLIKGQRQLEIASDLGVGVATVTRGSRELSSGRFKVMRQAV